MALPCVPVQRVPFFFVMAEDHPPYASKEASKALRHCSPDALRVSD